MLKNHFSQIDTLKNSKSFGVLPTGEEVFCYTISNATGMECDVINFGATIRALRIPLQNGSKVDVVLGFETIDDYINSFDLPSAPYSGAIVGRYAGRINQAQFELNSKVITLNKNHGEHHLHGGNEGFSKAFWNVIVLTASSITLQYVSKANEENFPGELYTEITYTITDENELKVQMTATSSEDTVINLTQHSYFNLDSHSEDIISQKLYVNASKLLKVTTENIPTGELLEPASTPYDYTYERDCPTMIDTTFVLNNTSDSAASLYSLKNKLKMSVYTNQPAVHVYVGGNCFHQIKGKENVDYHPLSGICFETQNFPDAPNHKHFPNAILRKDETYQHITTFKFENLDL